MARPSEIMERLLILKQTIYSTRLARRWIILSGLLSLIILPAIGGLNLVYAEDSELSPSEERVLHFPRDRSLGLIMVKDANIIKSNIQDFHDWYSSAEDLGEAQGDVVIPTGKKAALFLNKNAIEDLSPLLNLKPDDLYMLSLIPIVRNQPLHDKCMQHIAHLTGLKNLWLSGTRTTTESMKHITKLQSLEFLVPPTGLTNKGLSYVAQLESLKGLYFVENRVTNEGLNRYLPTMTKLEKLSLWSGQISDAGLVHLSDLPLLRYLSLNSGNFTDAGLVYLKDVPTLKILDLNHLPITDDGVRHLSGHPGLEDLSLFNTEVTDRGLAYLKSIPSLKKLNIGKRNVDRENPAITDAGMVHLAQINSLEYLDLPYQGITDKGIALIANLKNLKHLWVCASSVSPLTDKSMRYISQLHSLEKLIIGGTGFTDAGMDDLAKLTNLRELNLQADSITNEGLAKLKTLKSLEKISLSCKKVTISGLSYLNALPNLVELEVRDVVQDNSGLDISGLTKLERIYLIFNISRRGNELVFDPVRNEDLAYLKKLENLKSLVIPGEKYSMITDAGIAYLKDLPNMRELHCGSPYLTDKSLSCLANIKTLKFLTISGNFTDDGLVYLEGLKTLRSLTIYSANKFSPKALKRLEDNLSNLDSLTAEQNIELKKMSKTKP